MLIKALRKIKQKNGNIEVWSDRGFEIKLQVVERVRIGKILLDKGSKLPADTILEVRVV